MDVEQLTAPLLGWQVGAGMQTAYEVEVATTPHGLGSKGVWDSGKVASSKNSNIAYAGPALSGSSGYYWRVRTWDAARKASAWSSQAAFGTGPGSTWSGADAIWTTSVPGLSVANFTYTGTFTIAGVAASINFREKDTNNYYMWQFRTDGTLKEHKNVNGHFTVLAQPALPITLATGKPYDFKIVANGSSISTSIKGSGDGTWHSVGTIKDSTFSSGAIGFRTGNTESFSVDNLKLVDADGTVKYSNDFAAASTDFAACGAVADGAQNVEKNKNCGYFGKGSTNKDWAFLRGDVPISDTPIQWAHLYVAASSTAPARQFVAKTSVNGSVVGVGPSRPVGKETRYDGYDVTALLHRGANTISALAYTTSDHRYQAQLIVRYTDGTTQTFSTGKAWKALNGSKILPAVGSIGTNYYSAPKENYQAAKYPFGYKKPGYNDSAWPTATTQAAFANLVATPDAKVQQVLKKPTKVVEYSPGNYFIDYGRTWIGGLSLDLTVPSPRTIDIRYGEVTSAPNMVKYHTASGNDYEDKWTLCAGQNPLQTWGLRVFRYVNVLNAPTGLTAKDFTANAYIYPFDTTLNKFDSASSNLNQVWQLSKNTIQALNLNGYVDSYQRERGFYGADDYIQMMSNLSTGGDSTLGTYSTLYLLSNRTWPTEWPFYVILSLHDTWMATGDSSTMAEHYTQLQGKLPDQWYDSASGLVHKTTGANGCSSQTNCDIVDWPSGDRDGFVFSPYNTVINAISYRAYTDMADVATALGKTTDAAEYAHRAKTIKDGLNRLMWNAKKGAYSDGSTNGTTQIDHFAVQSTAFAVAMGVATPAHASAGAAYLGAQGMACSVYCADFMVQAGYQGNNSKVGTGFMTSTAAHSWMAMIQQGAGATMEGWNPHDKSNLTYSHPWSSSPASNIPQHMFGINPTTAGYSTFAVKPQATASVPWAHITVPTPKGEVGVAYDRVAGRTDVSASVPPNSTATINVPDTNSSATAVYVDGVKTPATYANGFLKVAGVAPGCHVLTTDNSGGAYVDKRLTAICPGTYQAPQQVNTTLQLVDSNGHPLAGGTASYYAHGAWHAIGVTDSNGAVSSDIPPGTYSFAMTYHGTRQQLNGQKVSGTTSTVAFQTVLVNVELQGSDSNGHVGQVLNLPGSGSASYYANGKWNQVTTKNVNNPKMVQAEMLPGTYSFAATYNGTRNQKKFTVLEPNANNDAHSTQSVYFHAALVNVWTENHASTPIGGGAASYYAAGTYHPVTTKDVNNPKIVQAEMLPGTYTFQDVYRGTHQKKKFTVLAPNANNGAHSTQSVYFHFAG